MQAPRIDPESLEQENDRSIDALGERTNLLRQVAMLIAPSQPRTFQAACALMRDEACYVEVGDGKVVLTLTSRLVARRSPMESSRRLTASTACLTAWCVAWHHCSCASAQASSMPAVCLSATRWYLSEHMLAFATYMVCIQYWGTTFIMQGDSMGSVRLGLSGAVDRFKKVTAV